MKPDPNRKAPKRWDDEEVKLFQKMVQDEGASDWDSKAQRLGSGRTGKALHTRWMRDQGRIVDKPRARTAGGKNENVARAESAERRRALQQPPPPPPPLQQQPQPQPLPQPQPQQVADAAAATAAASDPIPAH
jgi:hypothetical protein